MIKIIYFNINIRVIKYKLVKDKKIKLSMDKKPYFCYTTCEY